MNDFTDAPWLNNPPPPQEITDKIEELNGYIDRRIANYERIEEQLDLLFKDVEAGKFGDDAKTGLWYLHVKSVKDNNSKPSNPETLQEELDNLITKHHG